MIASFLLLVGCTSPDKLIGDSNVFLDDTDIEPEIDTADTEDSDPVETGEPHVDPSSINGVLSGGANVGEEVELTGLVVTSPSNDEGFYASDSEGGSNSGIWIQAGFSNKGIFDVEVGQQIDIVGTYAEPADDASTQEGLDNSESTIVIDEPGALTVNETVPLIVVEATEVSTEMMLDSETAESYEGSLVKIAGPQLIVSNNTLYLNGTLPVGDRFIPIDPSEVDESLQLEWAYGMIGYENGQYWLFPRSEADAVPAINYAADMTADQFFISEVFTTGTPAANCTPDLSWYLEITYMPNNGLSLLADTLYLVRYATNGTIEISKITPESNTINNQVVGIVSDVNSTTCLAYEQGTPSVLQHQTEAVAVLSSVSGLTPGDEIQLVYAETYDELSIGNGTVIDSITIGSGIQNGQSRALSSINTGIGTDDTNSSSWCDSYRELFNNDGDPLASYNAPYYYYGTPGSFETHCQ